MKLRLTFTLFLTTFLLIFSQKSITNEDIFLNRKFNQDWVFGLNSMNDGLHYTTLKNGDTTSIEKFSYENLEKVQTILKSSDIQNLNFSNYKFNKNEKLILLETESEKIYRYSKKSIFYVYNTESKELIKIFNNKIRLVQRVKIVVKKVGKKMHVERKILC